ncbi:hypothetical protein G6F41_013418 [Rhizopus arrhizus]|nr:hypothetical protein G6F41_013418 [Rhizopus arrhizus]
MVTGHTQLTTMEVVGRQSSAPIRHNHIGANETMYRSSPEDLVNLIQQTIRDELNITPKLSYSNRNYNRNNRPSYNNYNDRNNNYPHYNNYGETHYGNGKYDQYHNSHPPSRREYKQNNQYEKPRQYPSQSQQSQQPQKQSKN